MNFPTLTSGAVAQYGSPIGYVRPAQIIRFVDGTDQRFLASSRALRRWFIDLRQLNQSEISAIEVFFSAMGGGSLTSFSQTRSVVQVCRIAASAHQN